jgi:dihydrofolate synthase / folylpolyglutamate synthase
MTYQQALDYLFSQLPMFHRIGAPAYKPNLDNTLALSEVTGFPYNSFKTVHVAGTNGKGSVSHMLASICQEAGLKTGLFTSPHLVDFRERMKINGEMIPTDYIAHFVEKHMQDFDRIKPSFFEMTFVLAMKWFEDMKADIAIVEAGLGGRLDSTNLITPQLSVITNIGYDHMQFLGNTLKLIAGEKAGIIKPHIPVVIGETDVETEEVFTSKALAAGSLIRFADKLIKLKLLVIPFPETH